MVYRGFTLQSHRGLEPCLFLFVPHLVLLSPSERQAASVFFAQTGKPTEGPDHGLCSLLFSEVLAMTLLVSTWGPQPSLQLLLQAPSLPLPPESCLFVPLTSIVALILSLEPYNTELHQELGLPGLSFTEMNTTELTLQACDLA